MMVNYKELYLNLMAEVSDAVDMLITAMCKAEDAYCEAPAHDIERRSREEDS